MVKLAKSKKSLHSELRKGEKRDAFRFPSAARIEEKRKKIGWGGERKKGGEEKKREITVSVNRPELGGGKKEKKKKKKKGRGRFSLCSLLACFPSAWREGKDGGFGMKGKKKGVKNQGRHPRIIRSPC